MTAAAGTAIDPSRAASFACFAPPRWASQRISVVFRPVTLHAVNTDIRFAVVTLCHDQWLRDEGGGSAASRFALAVCPSRSRRLSLRFLGRVDCLRIWASLP